MQVQNTGTKQAHIIDSLVFAVQNHTIIKDKVHSTFASANFIFKVLAGITFTNKLCSITNMEFSSHFC